MATRRPKQTDEEHFDLPPIFYVGLLGISIAIFISKGIVEKTNSEAGKISRARRDRDRIR